MIRSGIDMFWPNWSVMLTSMARIPLHVLPTFRTVAQLANLLAAAVELSITHSAVNGTATMFARMK